MKFLTALFSITLILITPEAYSRDTKHMYDIQEAMQSADFQERLDPDVRFFFGNQKHPKVSQSLGNFVSNKKTNAFNKSDEEACKWVLLSALLSFQERVKREGGNAVINIASYYKKNTVISDSEYECHAGAFVAGVALTGDVVKLAK